MSEPRSICLTAEPLQRRELLPLCRLAYRESAVVFAQATFGPTGDVVLSFRIIGADGAKLVRQLLDAPDLSRVRIRKTPTV